MDLFDVAGMADTSEAHDAYADEFAFFCQYSNYNDSQAEGSTSRRRTMSTSPASVIPARRVVTLGGDPWLVGDGNVDEWMGEPIRHSYGMRKGTASYYWGLPGAMCIEAARPLATDVADYATRFPVAARTWAYGYPEYFKNTVDPLTSAAYDNFWNLYLSSSEDVRKHHLVQDCTTGTLLAVREQHLPPEGLRVVQADQLDEDAVQLVTLQRGSVYDPGSDTTVSKSVVVPAVQLDFSKDYQYRTEADALGKAGDVLLLVPKVAFMDVSSTLDMDFNGDAYNYWGAAPVSSSDSFTMLGRNWRVVSFMSQLDCWKIHARRA